MAKVVQLATTAMFKYHFAGHKFQQMEGGPFGLHGAFTIARLIMQIFDIKWEELIKLYLRYMDDGRLCLHAVKRGWRRVVGRMLYCKKWENEDQTRTLLDITVEAMKESMRGVTEKRWKK